MSQISGKQINNNSVNLSKLSGDGNVSFGNNTVVEFLTDAKLYYVDTPTELGEVTNKEYVDQKILDSINNAFILTYISKWNPITNTPTLTDSDISRRGEVYRASEQSTIFSIAWNIGDYLVYNENGIIEVSRNSDNVLSVNGEIGDVVLDLDWELKTDGVSRNNISPDSGINLVSGNNITLTYDNTSNNNSITIDSELTENPFGLEGQIYKIQTDNTNTIQAEDSIVEGNYIRSSDELSDAQLNPTTFTSFQEVFNTWQRFSHNSSTIPANVNETQQWNYTSGIDQINTTVNSTTHIGFVSDIPLSSYTLNATLTSPGSDDDGICIVIAYVEDENDLVSNQAFGLDQASYPGLNTTDEFVPNQHTITVILSRGGLNGSLGGSATSEYVIIYDFKKDTEQLLENGGSLIETPTTNSWNGAEIDVRVERDGNIITTSVLNFSDLTQDVTFEDTELTIDLNSLPILEKFKGPARYGFSSLSQLNSTYKNISISGSGLNEIYDLRTGEIYEADSSGTWTINTSRNLDNELLKRNIIFNPNFRTLLWYKGIGNFVTISENFEFFEGNISIDWDQVQNKPTLDNYASWNLKSNGFQRTGIFSDDSIDLVEGDGIDISYSAGGVINIASTFSESVLGLDYNNSTGILSTTTGYGIPTLTKQSQWDTSYNDDIESIAVTGTNTKTITLTQRDGSIISTQWTDLDSLPDGDEYINALSFSSTTGVLTAGRTGNLPDITASLDGRYSLLNHTNEDLTPGTGLSGDIYNGSSARTFAVIYGTTANTTTEGNDFRLSNARTPLAHSLASHEDVTISSNTNGEILKWTGTTWVNNTLSQAGIQPAGNYDNYASWNLKIGGTSRKTITSGNDVNFVAGDNISISYLAGGTVSISSSSGSGIGEGDGIEILTTSQSSTISVDNTVLRTTGLQTITGLKTVKTGGSSWIFETDNNKITIGGNEDVTTLQPEALDNGNVVIYGRNNEKIVDIDGNYDDGSTGVQGSFIGIYRGVNAAFVGAMMCRPNFRANIIELHEYSEGDMGDPTNPTSNPPTMVYLYSRIITATGKEGERQVGGIEMDNPNARFDLGRSWTYTDQYRFVNRFNSLFEDDIEIKETLTSNRRTVIGKASILTMYASSTGRKTIDIDGDFGNGGFMGVYHAGNGNTGVYMRARNSTTSELIISKADPTNTTGTTSDQASRLYSQRITSTNYTGLEINGDNPELVIGGIASYGSALYRLLVRNGDAKVEGDVTADNFFEGSDKRLKTNIKKISKSVYSYELKTQPGITVYGTIAQEIEKTNPGVVKKPEDGGMMSVNYNSFLSLKLAEQENENKEQNNKIDSLQQQIDELKELIKN
jgi:hypothetical protein